MTSTDEARAAAIAYGARGWRCFPIAAPDPRLDGEAAEFHCKLPRTLGALRRASADASAIRALFAGPARSNVGVCTGAVSGVVVLDVDRAEGGERTLEGLALPPTLTARTPGGLHLYFAHPGTPVPNARHALGAGVDVNGDGSFTTAPPSTHASGARYAWADPDVPLAALPAAVARRLLATPTTPEWRRVGRYVVCRFGQRPLSILRTRSRGTRARRTR